MTMQMPKWKTFTMESYEIPHIYREPNKAIFTTKKDKVTEADVQWMTRPDGQYSDPTRINEAIQVYPRGVDPVSKVKYGSNPYKIQVFRLPEVAFEQNIALSRPRIHQNKSVNSNPGIRESASVLDVNTKIDLYNINKMTSKAKILGLVRPTTSYRIDYIDPAIFTIDYKNKAINEDTDYYSVMANKIMKVNTDNNRDVDNTKAITEKVNTQNVLSALSSFKTNENNEQYTADKVTERAWVEVNTSKSANLLTSGTNDTSIEDKMTDRVRVMNIQASHSRPTTEVVIPDLNLMSKQDLQNIISKQVFRKDDITSAMNFNTQLNSKQNQVEMNSVKTRKELSTPIMNTDVTTVERIRKEEMPFVRSMNAIPNTSIRQEEQSMKQNNKRNLAFKMQMYNPELF